MNDEWIIQVDEQDNLIGKIERDAAHNPKDLKIHREVMLLLYTSKKHDSFLLQHRSMRKKQLPGYWTLSVTGHVDWADLTTNDPEGYLTAAKREAREEVGVEAIDLKLVGKVSQKLPINWAMMGIVTGEYERELKLDPEEVSEVKIFDRETVLQISDKLTPGAKACLEYLGILDK